LKNTKTIFLLVALLCVSLFAAGIRVAAFSPNPGDYFTYYEVENLGNGTGTYAGYIEHTVVNGTERINGVSGDVVSANYSYSYTWSNSSGSTESGTQSGSYTFSSTSFLYINGTDDQTGYVNPTVWFAMPNSTPVGGTFFALDTRMTVESRNYSYYLPTEKEVVDTIFAQGNSTYLRNDEYGEFNAAYTWNEYFDPTTGYVVGYSYVEHDTNSSGTGFGYTDDLYVTSSSYPLSVFSPSTGPVSTNPSIRLGQYSGYIAGLVVVIIIIAIIAYALSRRRKKLPEHATQQIPPRENPPPPGPPPSIDLTPKEQPPVQQIVIKEVAKVRCSFCGAMMDSTATVCPRCGAPRT